MPDNTDPTKTDAVFFATKMSSTDPALTQRLYVTARASLTAMAQQITARDPHILNALKDELPASDFKGAFTIEVKQAIAKKGKPLRLIPINVLFETDGQTVTVVDLDKISTQIAELMSRHVQAGNN